MISPDWKTIAENLSTQINDGEFFSTRSKDDFILILDSKSIKPSNFDFLFTNIAKYQDQYSMLDILSHVNVDYTNNISEILNNLSTLFHVFKIRFFDSMRSNIDAIVHDNQTNAILKEIRLLKKMNEENQTKTIREIESQNKIIAKNQNKIVDEIMSVKSNNDDIKNHLRKQITRYSYERMKRLEKTSSNFDAIYKIFCTMAEDDDYASTKSAMEAGYHLVTAQKEYSGDNKLYTENIVTYAATRNNFKLVKLLVECGVDPSCNEPSGYSPLWEFCMKDNLEAVKYFCSLSGANVNSPSRDNRSLLYIASSNDNYDMCKYLLSLKGIDKNMKANNGETALSVAKSDKVRRLIERNGCRIF